MLPVIFTRQHGGAEITSPLPFSDGDGGSPSALQRALLAILSTQYAWGCMCPDALLSVFDIAMLYQGMSVEEREKSQIFHLFLLGHFYLHPALAIYFSKLCEEQSMQECASIAKFTLLFCLYHLHKSYSNHFHLQR